MRILGAVLVVLAATFLMPVNQKYGVGYVVTLKADPSAIFAQLNNFRRFNEWSYWTAEDPDTQIAYSGPEEGGYSATSPAGGWIRPDSATIRASSIA